MRHLVLIAVATLFLLPLVWMVTTSLRQAGQPLPRSIDWIPQPIAWGNYPKVFDLIDFARFAANSLLVALSAVPLTVVTASWAGFALSQISQRWRLRLTVLSFATLMVPLAAVWLPRFILIKEVGLIDHRAALVVPALMGTSPFYVMLFLWTFVRVPGEVYEAARLDGAGAFRIWAGIALPLARPTTVAVAVLTFVYYWSSFNEPLFYIQSTSKMTLPLGLHALLQLDRTNWPILMAGAVMVTAPVVVLFIVAQRALSQEYRGGGWFGR
ncbi:MAG: hypothetical protein QOF33_2960 [Thermomicrobiales bacterium]|jgi:multiple sugar transport system permease protein|nr:hypothetical protein [Thermomicrobiales bacterium]MEA2532105.1 hypothetical protein [Thermomicrobiales bacterium]MEA2584875.1 hypothetical protein [Thermomicrobiales bacterium]MEA2597592.1 hypothetical protein [Thermomicrobiales bacterium]